MSTQLVPKPNATFKVRDLERAIDGDTVVLEVDKYHGSFYYCRVRLLEIDTPERRDYDAWLVAKQFTQEWCNTAFSGNEFYMQGHRMDSFGRVLGYLHDGVRDETLNFRLQQENLGVVVPLRVHLARFLG